MFRMYSLDIIGKQVTIWSLNVFGGVYQVREADEYLHMEKHL